MNKVVKDEKIDKMRKYTLPKSYRSMEWLIGKRSSRFDINTFSEATNIGNRFI